MNETEKQKEREAFYKGFTDSYKGDSGIGGNTPQEPVWDLIDSPKEVADYWLQRIDAILASRAEMIREDKYPKGYMDAHVQYVVNTLDGMKPEDAYQIMLKKIAL